MGQLGERGFSTAPKEKLYIRQDESADRPTAAAQMADENSLYHEIRRLIAVRQAHTALQSKGEIEFVYAEKDAYPLAYLRSSGEERILVVINPAVVRSASAVRMCRRKPSTALAGRLPSRTAS